MVITEIYDKINKFIDDHVKNYVLQEKFKETNKQYKNIFLSDISERIHLIKAPTGTGKTFISYLWALYLEKYNIIDSFAFLTSEYENGVETIRNIHSKFNLDSLGFTEPIYLQGKSRSCGLINVKNIGKTNLTRGRLLENGHPIKMLCDKKIGKKKIGVKDDRKRCKANCIYFDYIFAIIKGRSFITVQHQLNNLMPFIVRRFLKKHRFLIIIDEEFENGIKFGKIKYEGKNRGRGVITLECLSAHINIINIMIKERDVWLKYKLDKPIKSIKSKTIQNLYYYVEFLQSIKEFFKILKRGLQNKKINYNNLINNTINLSTLLESKDFFTSLRYKIGKLIVKNQLPIFKSIFPDISFWIKNFNFQHVIQKDIDRKENWIERIENWIRNSFILSKNSDYISLLFYNINSLNTLINKESNEKKIFKILINDATGDVKTLNNIIINNDIIEHNNDKFNYENINFIQLLVVQRGNKRRNNSKNKIKYAEYPKSSLVHRISLNKLIEDLTSIQNKFQNDKILVVDRNIRANEFKFKTKRNLKQMIEDLNENYIFDDYPLKGTNRYEALKILVIFGTPKLPPSVSKRQSVLLGFEDPELYSEIYSRKSIKQAFGRITRGIEEKWVILLTGIDLEFDKNINIKKCYGHDELKNFENLSDIDLLSPKMRFIKTINFETEYNFEALFEVYNKNNPEDQVKKIRMYSILKELEQLEILFSHKILTKKPGAKPIIWIKH